MLGAAPTLRTAAIGCRLQPTLLSSCAYTTSQTPLRPQESSSAIPRRQAHIPKRNVAFRPTATTIRHASSVNTPASAASTGSGSARGVPEHLDWNTFFKLRKSRRRWQLGSSVGTGINGIVVGVQALTHSDMEAIVSQIPLDPFITLGLITFACGGAGWLVGPIVGTAVFNYRNRKFRSQMDEKEKEFYRRIKKFRVDPSASSVSNPVPDYYGEKISSVAGYRRWLKDQRAFNKKRTTYIKI